MKNLFLTFLLLFVTLPAHAEIRVDITKGIAEPLPIAIPDFAGDVNSAFIGSQVAKVVREDLASSGLFDTLDPNSFIQDARSLAENGPRYGEWRAINAPALVSGKATRLEDGRTSVEYRLFDVFDQKQLTGSVFKTDTDSWRRIAHIIADDIYKRLTGEDGYFDTRIVYVAETGPANNRMKRLAIMDQDGANQKYLTDGSYMVLTPRFSPETQRIVYFSYYNNRPRVNLYDLNTGRQSVLGDFPGMTFSPRFSPDGKAVIMSLIENGNSDIHVMDINSRRVRRLTSNSGIDTSPSFSPDGQRVVFESDRGGSQQLYVMSASAGEGDVRRISFGEGRYANPVWSPRGDLIAFTKMNKGKFYIGVMRPDGSGERLITTAYHVEGPTWSPNGRVIAYFKETSGRNRKAEIYTIDITGYNERELPTRDGASDPAWSPVNPR